MSTGPSRALRRKWRDQIAREERRLIDPSVRAANEREYLFTHGYEPQDGTWLVPIDWIPTQLELMGQIDWVEYTTQKRFESPLRPRTFIFHHDWRQDHRPWLARGRNSFGEIAYAILGGGYKITAHGIEDDATDPRDIPSSPQFRVDRLIPESIVGMGKAFGFGYGQGRELDLSDDGIVLAYTRRGRARLFLVPGK